MISGRAAADGSFDIDVQGSRDDAYQVRAHAAEDVSEAVYVVRSGATVGSGRDGALSCEQRSELAGDLLASVAPELDRSCTRDEDCQAVLEYASCYNTCTYTEVSQSGARALEATAQAIGDGLCASYAQDGCKNVNLPCPSPPSVVCTAGRCARASVGPTTQCVGCMTETLKWGLDGGNVVYQDVASLEPCAHYSRTRYDGPAIDDLVKFSCEFDLQACNAAVSSNAVLSALMNADVQAALAQAPVLYGFDSRPTDGQTFRIDLGGKIIDVGDACGQGQPPGCVSAPAGVQALVDLLKLIDTSEANGGGPCEQFAP